jgi:short-subunit dehydrogenase
VLLGCNVNYFSGKRVWLTGASKGIGRALAIELAKRGAILALTSRDEKDLNGFGEEVARNGAKVICKPGDVTNGEQIKTIAAEIMAELGGIDILIANAGTHLFTKPEAFDTNEYLRLMDINYGGMLRCVEAVLPAMLQRGSGHLVAVASLTAYRGVPRAAAYGASKAAINNFLESLRFHLTPKGIDITVINPGFVRTPLTDKNDFKMPFIVEPDRAARIMCDGIARKRNEFAFPIPFNGMVKLLRIIPLWLYNFIMARSVKVDR